MKIGKTTATRKLREMKKRIRAVPGGTSASKTFSIVLILIDLALIDKSQTLASIVSESFPHLKRGAMRDFLNIMKGLNIYEEKNWNRTDNIYKFDTGSQIEFFSVDQSDKVRGARRDRLFINEANNVKFDAFEQLEVRTKDFIFLDWNPSSEFWYYEKVKKRTDVEEIVLTYKDNEALSPEIIKSIEQRKNRKNWWKVYGLGQLGEVEGKIYKDWQIIDEVPHEARLERRGLDFGYSNDPTAIISLYKYNGGFIINEECYQKGLSNKQIADLISNLENPQVMIVADSAEPKSIDEIKSYGVNIIGAGKGKNSVRQGIQYVQDQRISMTKRSVNVIKEYRNFLWATDRNGELISPNEPEKIFKHSMDAIVYAFDSYQPSTSSIPNLGVKKDFDVYDV